MDKIICAGKNYLDHALEMQDAIPAQPVLFLKPASVLRNALQWQDHLMLTLPPGQDEIHYECELVFRIKASGYQLRNLKFSEAFSGVSIGLDMTNRTQQTLAKAQGAPWTTGKVFPDAAVVGPFIKLDDIAPEAIDFNFSLNDILKQKGNSADMRMQALDLLYYASQFFPVCEGDLLFTGTPKGIGQVKAGDKAELHLLDRYAYTVEWQAF